MGRGCLDVSWAGETGGEGVVFLGCLTVVCVEMCVQRDGGQTHLRTRRSLFTSFSLGRGSATGIGSDGRTSGAFGFNNSVSLFPTMVTFAPKRVSSASPCLVVSHRVVGNSSTGVEGRGGPSPPSSWIEEWNVTMQWNGDLMQNRIGYYTLS